MTDYTDKNYLQDFRNPDYAINDILWTRWSPRALSGEAVSEADLNSLLEAARWAPSAYNDQPWVFLYSFKDDEFWPTFYSLLDDWNKAWADKAGVLMVIASRQNFEYNQKPNRTHSFTTGSAWQNLALQAASMGLVTHGMSGFDYEAAVKFLGLPADYTVEAMIAVGHHGDPKELHDKFQDGELPSPRKPISEISRHGLFTSI